MKTKTIFFSCLMMLLAGLIYHPVQAQQKPDEGATASGGPNRITRNVIQDKKGNIWLAAWQGMFKYDGKSFTNVTNGVSTARFFSVLEDRKGNFWFGSIGSGVYFYDGKSFKNFTTKDGLPNDAVTCIYEDKTGNIWLATAAGPSRYDGKSFHNFKIKDAPLPAPADSVHVSANQNGLPEVHWMHNDINAIIEGKPGKFWFATRGYASTYDGKTFTTLLHDGKPFTNVRSIIKDKKGNIWLGGADGLWRYDGHTFTNFSQQFVGYVYEDKKGNIWTSSESAKDPNKVLAGYNNNYIPWVLSRYDEKSLLNAKPTITEIAKDPMVFGILEDKQGNIWFGSVNGVYRYDGNTVTDFNRKGAQK